MASEKLVKLLESGEFDWENIHHRQQFMREWVAGDEELREIIRSAGDLGGDQECA